MAGISAIQRLLDNQLTSKFARSLKHSDLPEGWADNPEIVALAEDAYREAGTESPFFKAYFQKSKVVDSAGEPLKGYHGSAAEFDVFRPSKTGNLGPAIYTSPDREAAEEFAKTHGGANIYELFINSENPLTLSNSLEASEEFWGKLAGKTEADAIADLHKQGYDGAWAVGRGESRWGDTAPEIAVYSPYQLKSTSNRGTFNPDDPNIYKGLIPAVGAGGLLSLIGAEEAEAAPAPRFFRFSNKNTPMSDWGHAMFAKADSPQDADEILSGYGRNVYELSPSEKYPDVSELKNDILKAYAKSYKSGSLPYDMERLVRDGEYKADSFFAQFAPDDIVDSARAYDSEDYLPWFWENVIEPKGLDGVITPDGAISFNSDNIKKIYTKPNSYSGIPASVKSFIPTVGAGATAAALAPSSAEAAPYQFPADKRGTVRYEAGLESPSVDPVDVLLAPIGAVGAGAKAAAMAAEPFVSYGMDKALEYISKLWGEE